MPEDMRPDRVHLYVVTLADGITKVAVDPDYPAAWQEGIGKTIVNSIVKARFHALVLTGRQLNFVPAEDRDIPEKLVIEWVL